MKLYTFGDSHSFHGWDKIRKEKSIPIEMVLNHLGPRLMYTFGRKKLELLNINNYGIQDGDIVVFCFGEIDCRCHIYKFENYKQTIIELVSDYMDAIGINVRQVAPKKIKTCIYNVMPTVELAKSLSFNNPEYPFLGSDSERKEYVSIINELLKRECEKRGYIFIEILDKYMDENSFLSPLMSDGGVHIGETAPLVEFLKKKVLNV